MQRNLAYFNAMIPKPLSKIDFYLCFVSYYYSQLDKIFTILTTNDHFLISLKLVW